MKSVKNKITSKTVSSSNPNILSSILLLVAEHIKFPSMYVSYENFNPFKDTIKHLKWKKISHLTTKTNAK